MAVDTFDLLKSLASDLCPACGGFKNPRQTFCNKDYRRLPRSEQLALYRRVGSGYEAAVENALKTLEVSEPKLPKAKTK